MTHDDAAIRSESVARSVQRVPCPPGFDARDVAHEYLHWLPQLAWPLLHVEVTDEHLARFKVRPGRWTLLELRYVADRSPQGRQLFHVTGGLLAGDPERSGRLEFRQVLDGRTVLTAVHGFVPRLPWYVYNSTQALVHLFVMRRFRGHLEHLTEQQAAPSTRSVPGRTSS